MTLDLGMASVIVATIAATPASISVAVSLRQSRKVNETHKQVTVNHHSSDFPTVLDRIDSVQSAVNDLCGGLNAMRTDFNGHVTHSNDMDLRLIKVELAKEAQTEMRLTNIESEA